MAPRLSFLEMCRFALLKAFLGVLLHFEFSLAAQEVVVSNETASVDLPAFLSYYRDVSGEMALEEVRQVWIDQAEMASDSGLGSFGVTQDAIWCRFVVRSAASMDATWFLVLSTARIGEVDAYVVRDGGEVESFTAGNSRAKSGSVVDYRYPVFPFHLRPGEAVECLVRVRSESQIRLPLAIWKADAFAGWQARQEMFFAGFFGYLSALILLGVVFSFFTGDRGYAIYSLYLTGQFAFCFILSGYYVWLGLPAPDFMVNGGLIVVGQFALCMKLAYMRHLLDLRKTMPWVNRCVVWVMWACCPMTGLLLAISFRVAFPLFLGQFFILAAFCVAVSLVGWRRGNKVARFYLVAWVCFWVVISGVVLRWLAHMPLRALPIVYVLITVSISVTFFLVAMADRVQQIRRERHAAQSKVVELERKVSQDLRDKLHEEQLLIRNLHDGVGGLISNVAIVAELGRRGAASGKDRERFEEISELASESGAEVHSLMGSIEVGGFTWPDFLDECRAHGQRILKPHGIDLDFVESDCPEWGGPDTFAGLSLLRVLKEAFTNVVKHSGAQRVKFTAEFTAELLRIHVCDNGRGMTPGVRSGRGLGNMASRVREMRGVMNCHLHEGTELVFELPLPLSLEKNEGAPESTPHGV